MKNLAEWAQDVFLDAATGKYAFKWEQIQEEGRRLGLPEHEIEEVIEDMKRIDSSRITAGAPGDGPVSSEKLNALLDNVPPQAATEFTVATEHAASIRDALLELMEGGTVPKEEENKYAQMLGEVSMAFQEASKTRRPEPVLTMIEQLKEIRKEASARRIATDLVRRQAVVGPEGIQAGDMLRVTKAFVAATYESTEAQFAVGDVIEVVGLDENDADAYHVQSNGKKATLGREVLAANTTHVNRTEGEGDQPSMLDRARNPIQNMSQASMIREVFEQGLRQSSVDGSQLPMWFDMVLHQMPEHLIVQKANTGFTDAQATIRATFLMGQCTVEMWRKAVADVKKECGPEIKKIVASLPKWGVAPLPQVAARDIVLKVLQSKGIYPYPDFVQELMHALGFNCWTTPEGPTGPSERAGIGGDRTLDFSPKREGAGK